MAALVLAWLPACLLLASDPSDPPQPPGNDATDEVGTDAGGCSEGDCGDTAPLCGDGACQEGWVGDRCDASEDCQADPLWGEGICSAGRCAEADFVRVPAGSFIMGCPSGVDVDCLPNATTTAQIEVVLTRTYFVQTHEVTQQEWLLRMDEEPSKNRCAAGTLGRCLLPVERVNWYEALLYANRLSAEQGLLPCYDLDDCTGEELTCTEVGFAGLSCLGYRLPSEAEWEYMARAETTSDYFSGQLEEDQDDCDDGPPELDAIAWYCGNSDNHTHSVQSLTANPWGLYDVAGNVSEWVWDDHVDGVNGPLIDPLGPADGGEHVQRGGSYNGRPRHLQHGSLHRAPSSERKEQVGFRLVRTAP
jgi:formylglycine-generating enzyme required for sulfatase activity